MKPSTEAYLDVLKFGNLSECSDFDVCLQAIGVYPKIFKELSDKMRSNKTLSLIALDKCIDMYVYCTNPDDDHNRILMKSITKKLFMHMIDNDYDIPDDVLVEYFCMYGKNSLTAIHSPEIADIIVKKNPEMILSIINKTPKHVQILCDHLCKEYAVDDINNLDQETKLKLLSKYYCLADIFNLDDRLVWDHTKSLSCVKNIGDIYDHILETHPHVIYESPEIYQTPERCLKAVKQNPHLLIAVKPELRTEEMQWIALKKSASNILFIDDPTYEMLMYAAEKGLLAKMPEELLTKEICEMAFAAKPSAIKYHPDPSFEMIINAVTRNPWVINMFTDRPDVVDAFIEINPKFAINKMNLTPEQYIRAISIEPDLITKVPKKKNVPIEAYLIACSHDINHIKKIPYEMAVEVFSHL